MDPYNSRLPSPAVPLVNADGIMTPTWFNWFLTILNRTGGTSSVTATLLADLVSGATAPAAPVPLGGSPFVYTAPRAGSLLVAGDGVIRLEITANDGIFHPTGSWYGAFPLARKSQARLTYIGTPVVTFIPR